MRSRRRAAVCAISLTLTATLVACSTPPEQPILSEFFAASRLGDHTRLRTIATTAFDPRTQGIVRNFTITHVGEEQRGPVGEGANAAPGEAGDIVTKDVTISALVSMTSGGTSPRTLIVTLQRAAEKSVKSTNGAEATPIRWLVSHVKDAGS